MSNSCITVCHLKLQTTILVGFHRWRQRLPCPTCQPGCHCLPPQQRSKCQSNTGFWSFAQHHWERFCTPRCRQHQIRSFLATSCFNSSMAHHESHFRPTERRCDAHDMALPLQAGFTKPQCWQSCQHMENPALAFPKPLILTDRRHYSRKKKIALPQNHSIQRDSPVHNKLYFILLTVFFPAGCLVFISESFKWTGNPLMNKPLYYICRWDIVPISQLEK